MSDYISREAAIEKIRVAAGCEECDGSSSALCVCNVCDFYNAIRLIKSLPATDVEPVRRWIPCSERMPENHDIWEQYNVLLCTYRPAWYGDGDDEYAEEKYVLPAEYNQEQKVWRVSGSGEIINALIEEKSPWRSYISHWMPLPEFREEDRRSDT